MTECCCYRILALYRFVPLVELHDDDRLVEDDDVVRQQLKQLQNELLVSLRKYDVKGTILLAPEGINGTICYPFTSLDDDSNTQEYDNNDDGDLVKRYLSSHPKFGGPLLRTRLSISKEGQAFQRLKVKIKNEIVTIGHTTKCLANPLSIKGQYITPAEWDKYAILDPNVLVIDTRNAYEVDIGTFHGALNPNTNEFHQLPTYLATMAKEYNWQSESRYTDHEENNEREEKMNDAPSGDNGGSNSTSLVDTSEGRKKLLPPPKAIAMFCTGGIRCEKSTSYALQSGLFPTELPIYHLEGGILAYLDYIAATKEKKKTKQYEGDDTDDGQTTDDEEQKKVISTFVGECFVFDKRVAVSEGLKPTTKYVSCHGCRGPMDRRLLDESLTPTSGTTNNDMYDNCDDETEIERFRILTQGISDLPLLRYDGLTKRCYLPGLTCPRCHATTTRESLERFIERERQVEIAKREGKSHFQDLGV